MKTNKHDEPVTITHHFADGSVRTSLEGVVMKDEKILRALREIIRNIPENRERTA